MKRISLILLATLVALSLSAVPATPYPVEITLADGTTTQVYLRGDEYAHYYTLLDGTPIRLENGNLIEDSSLPHEARKKKQEARNKEQEIRNKKQEVRKAIGATNIESTFPHTGSPRGLIILVNFTDKKFTYTKDDFHNLLNQSGYSENGAIGSARDYFIAASDSAFQPIFDVYGPYELENRMAYYGGGDEMNAAKMVVEGCKAAVNEGVDLSIYDTNNDSILENVFVYYAGNNEAEGASANTVWPHKYYVYPMQRVGDVYLFDYACTSEKRGRGNTMCGISTFCHEFSHTLGLADLYDYDYKKETVGTWDIMASGSYNGNGCQPPTYSAFERYSMGWIEPIVLTEPQACVLEPLTTSNQAYLIPVSDKEIKPNENGEYLLLENRQKVGWEAGKYCLPSTGMLVWHLNYKKREWDYGRPNTGKNHLCFIECAAGGNKTSGRSWDPFPGSQKVTRFFPKAVNGTSLEKPLLDIKQSDSAISFFFIREGNKHLQFDNEMPLFETTYTNFGNQQYSIEADTHTLTIAGTALDPQREVLLQASTSGFTFSVDEQEWQTTLGLVPNADSTLHATVHVRYEPNRQNCAQSTTTIFATQGGVYTDTKATYTSPRGRFITEPTVFEPTALAPFTAQLAWETVWDATHYYLSVYELQGTDTLFVSGFENKAIEAQEIEENEIDTISCLVSGLKPETTYGYTILVSDEGRRGCEPNILQSSANLSFTTAPTRDKELDLGYGIENALSAPVHVIYLPESESEATLHFYDVMGHLVASTPVAEGQTRVEFPEGNFITGNIYIVKYVAENKLMRKSRRIKILY